MQNLPTLQLVKIWGEFDVTWIRARLGGVTPRARSPLLGPFPVPRFEPCRLINTYGKLLNRFTVIPFGCFLLP